MDLTDIRKCIYIHIDTCMYINIHMYMHTHTHTHTHTHIHIYVSKVGDRN